MGFFVILQFIQNYGIMKVNILMFFVSTLVFISCTNNNNSNEESTEQVAVESEEKEAKLPRDMELREWKLISFQEGGKEHNLQNDSNITIKFTRGRSFGSGGCNTFSAAYTLGENNGLSFGEVASTKKACTNLMSQEQTFFRLLKASTTYEYRDAILLLNGPDHILTFRYNASPAKE